MPTTPTSATLLRVFTTRIWKKRNSFYYLHVGRCSLGGLNGRKVRVQARYAGKINRTNLFAISRVRCWNSRKTPTKEKHGGKIFSYVYYPPVLLIENCCCCFSNFGFSEERGKTAVQNTFYVPDYIRVFICYWPNTRRTSQVNYFRTFLAFRV